MRKVLFKRWIEPKYPQSNKKLTFYDRLEGTGIWSDFIHKGIFHQWANAYEEFETGAGNYTVGLVEVKDGTIESVLPNNLKFI
jgi:hypothetical protein